MASQTTQTAEHIQPTSSTSAVQAFPGTAGPSSSTPTRPYQAQSEDVRLQKLVAVEKQFGLTPSETAAMSVEDRFGRIKSLKEEQKGLEKMRRERRKNVRDLEKSFGESSTIGPGDSVSAHGTTSSSRDRIDKLENTMQVVTDTLQQVLASVNELKDSPQGKTSLPTISSMAAAPLTQSTSAIPAQQVQQARTGTLNTSFPPPRQSVAFSTTAVPTMFPGIEPIPMRSPIEAVSMFNIPQQTRTSFAPSLQQHGVALSGAGGGTFYGEPVGRSLGIHGGAGTYPRGGRPTEPRWYHPPWDGEGNASRGATEGRRDLSGAGPGDERGNGIGDSGGPGQGRGNGDQNRPSEPGGPSGPGGLGGPGGGGPSGPGGGNGDPGGGPGQNGGEGSPTNFPYRGRRSNNNGDSHRPPRIPRQAEIGEFDPSTQRPLAFWAHVEHFLQQNLYEENAILGIVGTCMKGLAKDWYDTLWPRPSSWDEWRTYFFRRWTKDPGAASNEMQKRHFKPRKESLASYLYDKYWLIGMEGIARIVYNQAQSIHIIFPDEISLLMSRRIGSEMVSLVHEGLPSKWKARTLEVLERALSWEDYVQRMVKREPYLREDLDEFLEDQEQRDRTEDEAPTTNHQRNHIHRNSQANHQSDSLKLVKNASSLKEIKAILTALTTGTDEEREQKKKDRETGGCFLCHEQGHNARDCPNKKGKAAFIRRVEAKTPRATKLISNFIDQPSDAEASTISSDSDNDYSDGYDSDSSQFDVKRIRTTAIPQ
ncbi:hypothetical protein A4X13_0g8943 [Tilletia indica]|uniref:Uncharacterized protein n=1 Tax=Tilletia indica TaxID=43049 RepID=A0A177T9Y8_9BASI|nr:hypothetical protein A4X13_0g8943 [Tilletia indica]